MKLDTAAASAVGGIFRSCLLWTIFLAILLAAPMYIYTTLSAEEDFNSRALHDVYRQYNPLEDELKVRLLTFDQACVGEDGKFKFVCERHATTAQLRVSAVIVGVLAFFVPMIYGSGKLLCKLFNPYFPIIFNYVLLILLPTVTIILILQALLGGAVYQHLRPDVFRLYVWSAGAFSIALIFAQAAAAIVSVLPRRPRLSGKSLTKEDSPDIWRLVQSVSKWSGSKKPKYILVGDKPGCYVADSRVNIDGAMLKGRVLYLNVEVLGALPEPELHALLYREMRHFKRPRAEAVTTACSLYRNLLTEHAGVAVSVIRTVLLQPHLILIKLCLYGFYKAYQKFNKRRQIIADQSSARHTSPLDLATALLKVHLLEQFGSDSLKNVTSEKVERVKTSCQHHDAQCNLPLALRLQYIEDDAT
ncbi:MAG: hypothetical protein ACU85E_16650 [Gammaproteobacteria bacterium]